MLLSNLTGMIEKYAIYTRRYINQARKDYVINFRIVFKIRVLIECWLWSKIGKKKNCTQCYKCVHVWMSNNDAHCSKNIKNLHTAKLRGEQQSKSIGKLVITVIIKNNYRFPLPPQSIHIRTIFWALKRNSG
jgi:hypothetical protein